MAAEGQYADRAHRYRLDGRIATGGMGVVWRATDTRLDRAVAVKVLKPEFAHDPQFQARFETEARNAAVLQHPGIAGVFDYAADPAGEAAPYLVMELVDGEPLSTLLAQARTSGRQLDPAIVRDLMAQTADALAAAHQAGIVHRDVKPANLLVTADRRVKVTDFGIARAADAAQITRTGAVMGTPQYLSPEQARGEAATPASDVYSLGVVCFECLAGRRPFEAETPVATALAHLQQPVPELPASVPADLAGVVRRALAKNPAERFADGAAFAAALRDPSSVAGAAPDEGATAVIPPVAAAPGEPGPPLERLEPASAYTAPTTPTDQEPGRKRTKPWLIVLLVLLLVAAAVAAAFLLLGNDDEPESEEPTRSPRTRTQQTTPTTEQTTPTTPTTTATTEDTTVEVVASDYVGRNRFDVERDLQVLGLQVRFDEVENDGSQTEDQVSDVNPTGTLDVGDTVTVSYWGPAPPPTTPPTTPTTPTTPGTPGTTNTQEGG